jgi:hypothetical protein
MTEYRFLFWTVAVSICLLWWGLLGHFLYRSF